MKFNKVVLAGVLAGLMSNASADVMDEIKCMADNIYFEARNQSEEGQEVIGHVTMNRVNDPYYPNTVCEVVWEKHKDSRTGKWVAMFSWTLDGKSDEAKNEISYRKARGLAIVMIAGRPDDITNGATHYHADYVKPYWANKLNYLATVDNHLLYN